MRRYGQEIADDAEKGEVMRYKVTFAGGQVSIYDTKTPFEEFKLQFPAAVGFEDLSVPIAEVVPEAKLVKVPVKVKKTK